MTKFYSLSKSSRILNIFERLNQGAVIKTSVEAKKFNVHERTIRRYIKDIKEYFAEFYSSEISVKVSYCASKGVHFLEREDEKWLTNQEILVLTKILLESRAFTDEELNKLLDKLILQSAPEEEKHIKEIIANEKHHYNPVQHRKSLLEIIWDLSKAIRENTITELDYRKANSEKSIKRRIKPVGIMFSEFYFYLTAYLCKYDYEYPTIYRLDRIEDYHISKEKFHIPYVERFEDGEFRKRVQFMFSGKLMRLKFAYSGPSVEAVLDRLPTAKVTKKREGRYIIEAEVYGQEGVKMWLLSQGQHIEVLEPEDFREQMESTVVEMLENYSKD
ncbi:helix-turn-helix transcriptional regulator [Fuchsiella alkaliacetigena]|uniref:helix-turn-helix transcriptional regulator n=1 Tax=Fuchsiella alkaliacetigena TaxID=957042 RepID=UPI00200A2D29|nr:WYL domain-containing transcriptional regulator [Fuchsiella alkaliacetigena]MCK8825541.1 transcriptional regulator [Fuchsiella alkaliacetigena]